ncbi:hypothetical protein NEHOM01_0133 [Nematocida homosporus]|uniref:uncharacterized protein n=1 Tax=Nematocida homosporus TaxID=1912981 RepID=UPI00221FAB95|nr:uncharacterized protein NEHOM01_0133 [Nematocida homosporus]KAI5184388.1 hypothetical protein NEHOM01_0133 [Nematocida homosporus]
MGRQRIVDKEWDIKSQIHSEFRSKIGESVYGDSSLDRESYNDTNFTEEIGEDDSSELKRPKESKGPRKVVNRPASQPYIKPVNGENRLCFKYPTKMCDDPQIDKSFEETEFSIKFDIENVDIDKMTEKFKMDNSVYPRANVDPEKYMGNRWEYETEVNKLAWKLAALNPGLLYGKKGIVQRAVDSYRNLHRSTSSRRVVRMKKMSEGTLRKRHIENSPTTATVTWTQKGVAKKCKVRVDIETIDYDKIDAEFKLKYSVFSSDFDEQSFGLGRWENMNEDNLLAVKIAFLNVENTSFWNAVKGTDKVTMLRKAVEAYKAKKAYEETSLMGGSGESMGGTELPQDLYFIDPAEMSYREKSFYYYL